MTSAVNEVVRKIADSPFNDRLSRSIDWIVIGLLFVVLLEYELVRLSRRGSGWKGAARTSVFIIPLAFAVALVVLQRLKNGR